MVEGRQRADAAGQDRHRMGVAAEPLIEAAHLLVHHRVVGHTSVEVRLLRGGWKFAVEQEIAGLQEVAVLGNLFDREAAVEQDAFITVDVGDLGFAAPGRGEARVVGEDAGLIIELGDVHDRRTDRSLVNRERPLVLADRQLTLLGVGAGLRIHVQPSNGMGPASGAPQGANLRDGTPAGPRGRFPNCVAYSSVRCKMEPCGGHISHGTAWC
jgi:hypothetical protein